MRPLSFIKSLYRRLASRIRDLPIRHKFLVSLLVPFVPIFAASLIALQASFGIYNTDLRESMARALSVTLTEVESKLRGIQRLSFNIAYSTKTQELMRGIKTEKSDYQRLARLSLLRNHILAESQTDDLPVAIIFRDTRGRDFPMDFAAGPVPDESIASHAATKAAAGEGAQVWLGSLYEGSRIVSARQVLDAGENLLDPLGTLIFVVDIRQVVDRYLAGSKRGGERFYLLSSNSVLYSSGRAPKGLVEGERTLTSSRYRILSLKGIRYFSVSIPSGVNNWQLVALLPYNAIFIRTVVLEIVLLLFFGLTLFGATIGSMQLARSITRPLEALANGMRTVEQGSYPIEVATVQHAAVERNDEVGLLQRDFFIMIDKINRLVEENIAKQLLVREAEYRALQAQINPHFLYNTLGSINWLARMSHQEKISTMVESLGELFRASISGGTLDASLAEEERLLGSYLNIQRVRYENRINYTNEISEGHRHLRIPRLSLQSIVENSIIHAVEVSASAIGIRVWTEDSDDCVLLSVGDDGPGIDPEEIERLLSRESRGVGLKNINERMKLMYGEPYGLRIRSRAGEGFVVVFPIPAGGSE